MDGLGFRRVVHNAVSAQVTGALGGLEANLMVGVHLLMLHYTGIITNAANKAAIVSNTATFLAEETTFSLSLRYEP